MDLLTHFSALGPAQIVDELSVLIYEPPLSSLLERRDLLPLALRVPLLVIDFNTEVCMEGILGYLENGPGRYLPLCIAAFDEIGAHRTATTLREIASILGEYGVSTARLRSDFACMQPFQITSFAGAHGEVPTAMTAGVINAAESLYIHIHGASREPVADLLESFVHSHREDLLAALAVCSARATESPV